MSDKEIIIDIFDRDSIQKTIDTLSKDKESINHGFIKSIEELTRMGYEYMQSIVKIDSGELAGSITYEYDEQTNTGKIIVGASYAIFVEYGTGIVGADSPKHPDPAPGWECDAKGHGKAGWTYYDEKRQKYVHTKGQPASAFVYRTVEYLKEQADEVVRVNMFHG